MKEYASYEKATNQVLFLDFVLGVFVILCAVFAGFGEYVSTKLDEDLFTIECLNCFVEQETDIQTVISKIEENRREQMVEHAIALKAVTLGEPLEVVEMLRQIHTKQGMIFAERALAISVGLKVLPEF